MNRLPFFATDLARTKFCPQSFATLWNVGLPSFVFARCQMKYTEREQDKYVLKTRFNIPITLLVMVALIPKVVGNLY